MTTKRCSKCSETKPVSEFGKRKRSKDGLQPWCSACMKEANAGQYQRTRDTTLARHRAYHDSHREEYARQYAERPKHGLTPAQKREHLDAIGWACELCARPFTSPSAAHVDHDHSCCPGPQSCGECIRGFLCGPCNRSLGGFGDDRNTLAAAIHYLDRYEASQP